uniref:Uncharacterized protein n=1 Tax=Rhizophora mucronata TaxID=61149 RepID=A0A2P2N0Z4_RHIMU
MSSFTYLFCFLSLKNIKGFFYDISPLRNKNYYILVVGLQSF